MTTFLNAKALRGLSSMAGKMTHRLGKQAHDYDSDETEPELPSSTKATVVATRTVTFRRVPVSRKPKASKKTPKKKQILLPDSASDSDSDVSMTDHYSDSDSADSDFKPETIMSVTTEYVEPKHKRVKCRLPGCNRASCGRESVYCGFHQVALCGAIGCRSTCATAGERYCARHMPKPKVVPPTPVVKAPEPKQKGMCRVSGCEEPRMPTYHMCKEHKKATRCIVKECMRPKKYGGYCVRHDSRDVDIFGTCSTKNCDGYPIQKQSKCVACVPQLTCIAMTCKAKATYDDYCRKHGLAHYK